MSQRGLHTEQAFAWRKIFQALTRACRDDHSTSLLILRGDLFACAPAFGFFPNRSFGVEFCDISTCSRNNRHLLVMAGSILWFDSLCYNYYRINTPTVDLILVEADGALGAPQTRFAWHVQHFDHLHTGPGRSGDN